MITAIIIILSIFVFYRLFKLCKKSEVLDDSKVLSNRLELSDLAINDWKQGKINKELFRTLNFVFHPDFKNTWDYVPPERQVYTRQMHQLDSNFWRLYKLTPDFVIPAHIVYELYKEYLSQQAMDNLKSHLCSELNISSQTKD